MDTDLTSISTFGWYSEGVETDHPLFTFGWYDVIYDVVTGAPEIVFRNLMITRNVLITFER